jgi:dihydropteroate synthase
MGIINVTPDSFSDGGSFYDARAATDQARRMIEAGADIIDIGGESTRPYADPVSLQAELDRVLPVITSIREFSDIPISIDTAKGEVARQALDTGADIINDVTALRGDPEMLEVVRNCDAELIIMHMQGTPRDMQDDPAYADVVEDVLAFFRERLAWLQTYGVGLDRVTIDPGIGFGKKLSHNLLLIKHIERLSELGQPVMLGHSRKRFLGDITGLEAQDRDPVTAVVTALCHDKNVAIIRVHDVTATISALTVAQAISRAG